MRYFNDYIRSPAQTQDSIRKSLNRVDITKKDEEKQYVKDHIPYTASLTQEEIDKHDVLNTKDKWVIKPEDSYASKGVYAGVEGMSDHAWKEEVLSNVDNHYLLQEYSYPICNLEYRHHPR